MSSPPRRERVAEGGGSHADERNLERGRNRMKDGVVATREMTRRGLGGTVLVERLLVGWFRSNSLTTVSFRTERSAVRNLALSLLSAAPAGGETERDFSLRSASLEMTWSWRAIWTTALATTRKPVSERGSPLCCRSRACLESQSRSGHAGILQTRRSTAHRLDRPPSICGRRKLRSV